MVIIKPFLYRPLFANKWFKSCINGQFSSQRTIIQPIVSVTKCFNHKIKEKLLIKSQIAARSLSSTSSDTSKKSNDSENPKDDEEEEGPVPLLMNFVPRGMPNLFMSLKNFYIINVIIRNQIDRNFMFNDFIEGAKQVCIGNEFNKKHLQSFLSFNRFLQALIHVSSRLANNQLNELEGLIEPNALVEINRNYEKLSMAQRRELQLQSSDIVLSFAHHIDVATMKEEFTGTRKHIVTFFIVFDCIKNLQDTLQEKARNNQQTISVRELFREFHDRKIICNYEFQREYIEGVQGAGDMKKSDWIITKLLHIKEKDLIRINIF